MNYFISMSYDAEGHIEEIKVVKTNFIANKSVVENGDYYNTVVENENEIITGFARIYAYREAKRESRTRKHIG